MGVTYKLKDEVLQFIIQRKTDHPKISCRDISDEILTHFDLKVSKSSVHEALKHAGVVTPKAKKVKDVFEIPQTAKTKIMADLVKVAGNLIPASIIEAAVEPAFIPIPPPENALPLRADPVESVQEKREAQIIEPDKGIESVQEADPHEAPLTLVVQRTANFPQAGAVFLQFLAQEMGLKDYKEFNINDLEYCTYLIDAYKLIFNNRAPLYLDSQYYSWSSEFRVGAFHARLLPGAIMDLCDRLINNVKPVVLNNDQDEVFDLEGLMAVECLDRQGQTVTSFDKMVAFKRQILRNTAHVMSESIKYENITKNNINSIESMAYEIFGKGFTVEEFTQVLQFEGFKVRSIQGTTLNIIVPDDYPHTQLLKSRLQQVLMQYQSIEICLLSNS